jgi:hypothetical protein
LNVTDIDHVDYIDGDRKYGINIALKSKESIFLPYFSKNSFDRLRVWTIL